jgi:uncharacterized membrane protein
MAQARASTSPEVDRNLAFLAYGLLFFAVFFAGAPALIAFAIAHARKDTATPLVARHHRYQIFVFWIGFGLALLASASGLAMLVVSAAKLIDVAAANTTMVDLHQVFAQIGESRAPIFFVSALVLTLTTALWLVGASAYGFFRLASGKAIVQTPQP